MNENFAWQYCCVQKSVIFFLKKDPGKNIHLKIKESINFALHFGLSFRWFWVDLVLRVKKAQTNSLFLVPIWVPCALVSCRLKEPFKYYVSKEVCGVRKWHFLLIYSTTYLCRRMWVGLTKPKTCWRNTWMVRKQIRFNVCQNALFIKSVKKS